MKLIKVGNQVTTHRQLAGLYECTIKNEIKAADATLSWMGPKIPPEAWQQVMAFFQYVYDNHKSECQVRMFANAKANTWLMWAFPQELKSYMHSEEIDNEEFKAQRALVKESEGWEYAGTAHHHCGMDAFQSSTDLNNEQHLDGLHITIGNMNRQVKDFHARVHMAHVVFEPDMSMFWDIGQEAKRLVPFRVNGVNIWDAIAREQMCQTPDKDKMEFPEQWKKNLMERKVWTPGAGGAPGFFGSAAGSASGSGGGNNGGKAIGDDSTRYYELTIPQRGIHAVRQIMKTAIKEELQMDDVDSTVTYLRDDDAVEIIMEAVKDWHIDMNDLYTAWPNADKIEQEWALYAAAEPPAEEVKELDEQKRVEKNLGKDPSALTEAEKEEIARAYGCEM